MNNQIQRRYDINNHVGVGSDDDIVLLYDIAQSLQRVVDQLDELIKRFNEVNR